MLWMCCGTFLYSFHCWDSIRGMRMDLIKCVLRGRSNDFVTAVSFTMCFTFWWLLTGRGFRGTDTTFRVFW